MDIAVTSIIDLPPTCTAKISGFSLFPPQTLQKMVNYLDKKKCTGVAFYEHDFFVGNNKNKLQPQINRITARPLELADLFDGNGTYIDNFLYTKISWLLAGGYPENHDLDTPCFEFKYLAKAGNSLYVCPEARFYHRIGLKQRSYFERMYVSGEFSRNYYLALEGILYLFFPDVRKAILEYDIFKNSKLGGENLKSFLDELYKKDPESFFRKDKAIFMQAGGTELFCERTKGSTMPADVFALSVYEYLRGNYDKALGYNIALMKSGANSPVVYHNVFRAITAMNPAYSSAEIDRNFFKLTASFRPVKQNLNLNPNILIKILIQSKKVMKKFRIIG